MQAALTDLTPNRLTNPRPFLICQRVLHKCHEIIFGDPPAPSRSPYRSLPHSPPNSVAALHAQATLSNLKKGAVGAIQSVLGPPIRINAHVPPALVGMGVILAGPGMTGLVETAGRWAITQGRRPLEEDETRSRVEVDTTAGADAPVETRRPATRRKASEESDHSDEEVASPPPKLPPSFGRLQAHSTTLHLPHPSSTAPDLSVSPPAGTAARSLHLSATTPPARLKAVDPFSQSPPSPSGSRPSTPPKPSSHQPFYSVPEFSTSQPHQPRNVSRRLHPTDRPPPAEHLLATYSIDAQRQLLRSHYCRSEVRFLLLLEDISNRLLVVPKPARVSALRAELTSINHNLPAEVRLQEDIADCRCVCHYGALPTTRMRKGERRLPVYH
jgi:hypothetical protein